MELVVKEGYRGLTASLSRVSGLLSMYLMNQPFSVGSTSHIPEGREGEGRRGEGREEGEKMTLTPRRNPTFTPSLPRNMTNPVRVSH